MDPHYKNTVLRPSYVYNVHHHSQIKTTFILKRLPGPQNCIWDHGYWTEMKKTWWRHQMESFSASLAFVWGIHRSTVNSPHKGQWRGALMFSFICAWINGWVKNHEAGYLRRHRSHHVVIEMNITQSMICQVKSHTLRVLHFKESIYIYIPNSDHTKLWSKM